MSSSTIKLPQPQSFPRRSLCAILSLGFLLATLITCLQLIHRHTSETQLMELELERRLPQSIVIGARKCGTRALLDFLEVHPMVRAATEEVHYFDREDRQRLGLDWYRSQMPPSHSSEVTLEKSPAYFVTRSVPARIWRMNPRVKLLVILRDPVDRVVSDYAQHVFRRESAGQRPKPLESIVLRRGGTNLAGTVNPRSKMVHTSLYYKHLRRWMNLFSPSQMHIVDGDRLIREPHTELQLVEQFLGLPRHIDARHFEFNTTKGFFCLSALPAAQHQRCLGSEKGRRHPMVANTTLAKLRRFYRQHDKRLAELTGRQFEWMRHRGTSGSVL